MKVLIIGAGAVGQVYGHHITNGGADVAFYIKEKFAAELDKDFYLYKHSILGKVLESETMHHHIQ